MISSKFTLPNILWSITMINELDQETQLKFKILLTKLGQDEAFRSVFSQNPAQEVEKMTGYKLPEGSTAVVRDISNKGCVLDIKSGDVTETIEVSFDGLSDELSDDELESVAGGAQKQAAKVTTTTAATPTAHKNMKSDIRLKADIVELGKVSVKV
jgi:hypothetical protein